MGRLWAGAALRWIAQLWVKALRYHRVGPIMAGPGLVAFWHGDQLPLLGQLPQGPLIAPVSMSADGRMQARILRGFGIETADGSSHRGGVRALLTLRRFLTQGSIALMAVDGPTGPRGEVKPGIIYLAQKTGLPIWIAGVAVRRGVRLTTAWDHFLLPLPFTRTVVRISEPWFVPAGVDLTNAQSELAQRLADTNGEARAILLDPPADYV